MNNGEKYQFHLSSAQLMDVKDESVNFDDFNKKYPWVPSEELKKLAKKNI
jgi:hypothetical protein